jgi:hypothetical protein
VFADAASALALPLREDATRLHVTLASSAGDRWFLLESPEPIDFTEEVELRVERRVVRPGLSPADRERLGALIEAAIRDAAGPGTPFFPHLPKPAGVRARLLAGGVRWSEGPILDRSVAFTATLEGRYLAVTEVATGTQRKVRATGFTAADRDLLRDVTVDLNRALRIVRWHVPETVDWVVQPVSILQNAEAKAALVLPHAPLPDGTYRLSFAISRPWFATTELPGPTNTYLDEGAIDVVLAG